MISARPMPSALSVERLVLRYGPFLALDGVDLRVDAGEIVGLIGPNGAGKSSLLRCIAGLVRPSQGAITLQGVRLDQQAPQWRNRAGLSLVPEGRGLFAQMSVEENLMMGGYSLGSRRRMRENIDRCCELFPILKERRRQVAGTLSGGQQQMVAVSMGLMSDPAILLLDEPSLGLAPIVIAEIGASLRKLRDSGLTVLLSEQNATLTCGVADRIYILQTGRVRYEDTPERLFADPEVMQSFLSVN
jgi:branched-chain amino acid transport system ATP-binding protein